MELLMKYTVYLSLFVQIATGIMDALALRLNVPPNIIILRQALILELIVQIIEGIFYIWLVLAIHNAAATNVTPKRYYDWFLTTPTMLFTLMIYLSYLKNKKTRQTLGQFVKKHKKVIGQVVVLNALMLLIGYMGEIGKIHKHTSVVLGFIPFVAYYTIIYNTFVKDNPEGEKFFWYFVVVWAIYGFAALLPYHPKNTFFNILDLFSKNFFGVYLAYLLYISSKSNQSRNPATR